MPCWNAGRMLQHALKSLEVQSYRNIELIFVDDGSTDGSVDVATAYARTSEFTVRVTHSPSKGVNNARRHGMTLAGGEFVQWLDADDALAPEKIAKQAQFLVSNPEIDIAYGDWIERDYLLGQTKDRPIRALTSVDHIRRTLSLHWHAPHSHLLRRSAANRLEQEQAYFPGRTVATDVEYFAIAALLGLRFAHVPELFAVYNIWSNTQISVSTDYLQRASALRQIFERLNAFSKRDDVRSRIKSDHRKLLNQNWDMWAVPTGTIVQRKDRGRQITLLHRESGKSTRVRPNEARALSIIESSNMARFLAHHATLVAATDAKLFRDEAEIIFFLEGLCRASILMQVPNPNRV